MEKKSKMADSKNLSFFNSANSYFFLIHGLVLGLVGLIDAKGIDVAQPRYMAMRLSNISLTKGKKCIMYLSFLAVFELMLEASLMAI